MPAIGDVKINLVADAAKVVSGTAQGERALSGFAGRVRGFATSAMGYFGKVGSALTSVKGAVIGAAAAIGAYKIAGSLNASAEAADKLGKKAKTLGIGVEPLSAIKFAAEEAGVEFDTLAKMISKSQRSIVEAVKKGSGGAAEAFHELGFSVAEVGDLLNDPVKILPTLARAFEKVQTQGDKLSLAEAIFGKGGGEEFVMFLEDSGGFMENLVDQTERARRLGAIITPEQVAKLTAYNDAVGRISVAWRGFATNVMSAVAPALTYLANNAAEIIAKAGRWVGDLARLIVAAFKDDAVAWGLKYFVELSFELMWDRISFGAKLLWKKTVNLLSSLVMASAPELKNIGAQIGALLVPGGQYFLKDQLDAMSKAAREHDWSDDFRGRLEAGSKDIEAWASKQPARWTPMFAAWTSAWHDMFDGKLAQLKAQAGEVGSVYDKLFGGDGPEKQTSAMTQAINGLREEFKRLGNEAKDFGRVGTQVASEITNGLSSGIPGALIQVKAGFKNMGREALAVLQRVGEAIAQTILQALIMRAVTGIANSVIGGTGTSGLNYNPAYSLPAGIQGPVPARASGGPVRGGGLYLVGENGPELMQMQSAGQVYNARDTRSMLSGGDVSVQVIDQRGSGQRPQVSQSNGPDGRKQLRILIRDEVAAGISEGSFDKVMGTNFGVGRRSVGR